MVKTDKKCKHCQGPITQYKNAPIANFTNSALGIKYYFCGKTCKLRWLSERLEKKIFDESRNLKTKAWEKFPCKYCGEEWSKKTSRVQHERWCPKGPNPRKYRDTPKASKPKLIKEDSEKKENWIDHDDCMINEDLLKEWELKEASGGEKTVDIELRKNIPDPKSPCCKKCIKDGKTKKYCNIYRNDCHHYEKPPELIVKEGHPQLIHITKRDPLEPRENEKFAVLDDTILFIWKNAKILTLESINGIIQDLIEMFS